MLGARGVIQDEPITFNNAISYLSVQYTSCMGTTSTWKVRVLRSALQLVPSLYIKIKILIYVAVRFEHLLT